MPNENDDALGSIADAAPGQSSGSPDSSGGSVPQGQGSNAGSAQSPDGLGTIADDQPGLGGQPAQEAADQEGDADEGRGQIEQEAYTLTIEDEKAFPMPAENLASYTAACKKAGLTKKQAQDVLAWHQSMYRADQAYYQQEQTRTLQAWQKEIFEDREFGGANYRSTIADGRKALAAFDPDGDVRDLLRKTGAERHPAVIRLACRIGRSMGEHQYVGANGAGVDNRKQQPLWQRIYGESGTEQKHSTY